MKPSTLHSVLKSAVPTLLLLCSLLISSSPLVSQPVSAEDPSSDEAVRQVKEAFDRAGIAMPEPLYQVKMVSAQAPVAEGEERAVPEPATARQPQLDVAVDHHLDEQIEEDRQRSHEGDLLTT